MPDVPLVSNYDRYGFFSLPNISFVIPPHHPVVATYYCSVWGTHMFNNNVLLAREKITIKVKGTHNHACVKNIMRNPSESLLVTTITIRGTHMQCHMHV